MSRDGTDTTASTARDMPPRAGDRPGARRKNLVAALRSRPAGAWATGLAATLLYTLFSVTQWYRLDSPSWDLGIFTQLAKAYAAPGAPIVPIKGEDFNLLGDHFHPLLVLLGPAYALSWGLQSAVAAQFHEIAFAVPLLALSLEAVLLRRVLPAVVWGGLLVFVKEDLGLTVIALGLVLAWRLRTVAGLWLSLWGALWLIVSVRVILPALNTSGQYDYSDRIDVGGMIADPAGAVVDLVSGTAKHETLLLLLLAGGVLFLRSSLSLVLLPTILWRFASGQEGYWGPEWHYSAVLMPVLFLALVDGVRTLRMHRRTWVRTTALVGVSAAVLACLVLLPGQKFAALAEPETYRPSDRWDAAHRMMDLIPAGSSVESGVVLMAYLVPETRVYGLGNPNPAPDYLVVDAEDWSWGPVRPGDAEAHAEQRFPGTDYTLVFDEAGYQLVELER